jgi:hypothetical protein
MVKWQIVEIGMIYMTEENNMKNNENKIINQQILH